MRLLVLLSEYAELVLIGERTLELHKLGVRQFSFTVQHHAEVADFTDLNIVKHATRRLKVAEPATVDGEQRKLLALWRFAARQGYCTKWPTVRPVKVPDRVPRAWTADELTKLFRITPFASPVGNVHGPTWWRALFLVLWDTGERIEATMHLQWVNVDLEARVLLMPAETRKGGQQYRSYRIAEETAEILAKLPRDRPPFWFPYCSSTLYNRLKKMLLMGGLPTDRTSKFHRIRKSVASHYEAAGGNATELLGHTSRKVTRCYLDPRIVKPPSAIDLLFRPEP